MNYFVKAISVSMFLIGVFLLTSCGGDGIGGTGYPYTDLDSAPSGSLYRSDEDNLALYFQKSAKLNYQDNSTVSAVVENDSFDSSGADPLVSSTNIQELGVQEADLIKTNGRYIYSVKKSLDSSILSYGVEDSINDGGNQKPSDVIRVMEAEGQNLKEVKHFTKEGWDLNGLYLYEEKNKLIALSSANKNYYDNWFNGNYFANQKTEVIFLDVEDIATSSIKNTLSFDGVLISSRRNNDVLYLVLRHYPNYQYSDDKALSETTSEDFLPHYKVGDSDRKLLTKATNCFLEKGRVDTSDVITLVAIDLKSNTPKLNSQCFVGSAEAFYASQNALYLATTRWGYDVNNGVAEYQSQNITTDIHKFAYDGLDFDYRGSGVIDGHLGYKQDAKSFRFSESKGLLRVISFNESLWNILTPEQATDDAVLSSKTSLNLSPVLLTILKESPNKKVLEVVSKLPNTNRANPIGKQGEKLYATRFIGDRAYIVTFRVVDPLYVLNLSNPEDPFIAGELKVDGYSDYLQPISENLLLGVGKDAIPADSFADGRGAWYQGVKLSLIDVTNASDPREVDKVILGKRGTETAALYTHHAMTGLKVGDQYRVAVPVQLHEGDAPTLVVKPSTYYPFKHFGLYRFDIDINNQKIIQIPPMITQGGSVSLGLTGFINDRSVFINDNVHFMHNGDFWSQDWKGINPLKGPK